MYDDTNIQQFILVLNPTDNPKLYTDAFDSVKQKFAPSNIFEVPMSGKSAAEEEDMWSRHVDLDEQVLMQELHMEQLVRGRSFSSEDRLKIKGMIRRLIEK